MAFKTLTIKESTYKRLAKFKTADESFSDLLDREFENKILTTKDLLSWTRANSGRKLGLGQRKNSPYLVKK